MHGVCQIELCSIVEMVVVDFVAVVLSLLTLPASSTIPLPISCQTRCYLTVFIADLFRMFKVWVSVEAAPTHSILDEEKDDIARIISPDLTAHFTVSFDGEEKQLDESVPLNTSRVVPLIFSALPLPPPLPPPPPTLRGI